MILERNENAKVIALNTEVSKSFNYHGDLIGAMALTEKSKSFYYRINIYHVVFALDNGNVKEFVIDKKDYDSLKEGQNGTLEYFANHFVSFAA